jgi:acyl-CoA reductase-like NAD-dependent aldehyde dehydrogenase
VRAAYESGTPAVGVGAGNVSAIVDETADVPAAAAMIARSKTFDHATSCSSENSVIAVAAVYDALVAAFAREGGALLERRRRGSSRRRCSPAASSRPRSSHSPPMPSPRVPRWTVPRFARRSS